MVGTEKKERKKESISATKQKCKQLRMYCNHHLALSDKDCLCDIK